MFYHLKIFLRSLRRNRTYTAINIAGLAVSLAAVIIIALWVDNELNFNRWYNNTDRLYVTGITSSYSTVLNSSEPLFKMIQSEFPEVKRVSHFSNDKDVILFAREDDMVGFNVPGAWVDSTIFEMLDVKFIRGSAQSAFHSAFPILISEGLAKKLFGKEDPIGKTLRVNRFTELCQVTGIFRKQPKNSSFQFQWLMPFAVNAKHNADKGWNPENDWNTTYFTCCVELYPKVDVTALSNKLKDIENKRSVRNRDVFLYPISQLYLYGEFVDGKPVAGQRVGEIKKLSFIGLIILLISCINFINLATARSEKRMVEMGVRKTFGAKRIHLIWQMMRESAILIVSSLVLALMAVCITLPFFNRLWDIDLSVHLWNIRHLCGILLVGIVCTVLSGIYPAIYISAFNPLDIMKKLKSRSSTGVSWMRRGLVMFQFAVSFVLICVTIAVFLQIRLGQNRPLGYNKEHLLRVSGVSGISSPSAIRNELAKSPLVMATAFANSPLVYSGNVSTGFQWQGKSTDVDPATVHRYLITPGYLETIGFTLLEGRDFYEGSGNDARSVIINKTLADMIGFEDRINREIWQGERESRYTLVFTIIGVIDDYICDDLYREKSAPMMFQKESRESSYYLYVRFNSNADIGSTLKLAQNTLSQFPTDKPLEYAFMDDAVNRLFDGQRQEGFLVMLFSALAILISCLGLFGLITYIAETKAKEIGIRKILGASVGNLVMMLTKEFLILVTVSALIAFPLAYWWIEQMLQDYGYRISVGWELFAMTFFVTMVLTLLTVGFQVIKAATENPVKAIKSE